MPAGSDGVVVPSLPHTWRPVGARVVAAVAAVVLVGTLTVLWLLLPDSVQDRVSLFQRITLVVLFAAIVAPLHALFRTSASATEEGLTVVNGYRTRHLQWAELIGVSINPNRAWALLDLADGETLSVLAIQSSDGARASRSTRELAGVIAQRSRADSD